MASTETFATGANRNDSTEQIDPEGFLNADVLQCYFDYMHKNRFRPNGEFRDSDNWQLGIPQWRYMKSLWRHFFAVWRLHRAIGNNLKESSPDRNEKLLENLNGVLFNAMGYMQQELQKPTDADIRQAVLRDIRENGAPKLGEPRRFVMGKVSSLDDPR